MLDAHFLADGEIEFLRDERLAQVDGELGIARDFGQRPRAEAFPPAGRLGICLSVNGKPTPSSAMR